MFSGQFNYDDRHEDRFQRYWLDYPQEGSQTDFRNQWFKDRPNRNYGYSARAEYIHLFGQNYNSTLRPFYEFMQKFTDRDYLLYRLDELGGEWGQDTDTPLGALPSETDYLLDEVADRQNSYRNRYIETEHRTGVDVYWCRTPSEGREWVVSGTLPLRFQRKRTRYTQASIENGLQSRSAIFFEPSLNLQYFWSGQRRNIRFHYDVSSMSPNPVNLFDVEDSSDPLNISRGNPGLGNLHTHNLQLIYESRNTTSQHFMGAFVRYRITQNAIAYGSTYDRETGVRVTRPENVDGNYRLDGDFTYSLPLDKAKRLLLGTQTNVNFQNSVDLARVADAPASSRSTVQTLQLGETLKLDYRMGKVKLGAKAGGTWTRAGGSRQDFSTVNAGDFNYGVTAQLELPWDMQLYTDLTQYSRRGYDDSGMNTDDLVWNARLSKRLMKGRLTLMLDGFDILQNLSNITRSLDAQGRVETWRNVIPRYVMLHAVYRFSVQPKKKPGE